ncbi:MAG TPA: FAD-dependent oxidoreductase, partial [Firmicutes bacterium]|nr:FAD-dependent oxidoreductase [Bacillota bacterium]
MKVVIVGGVAGGATAAARIRRLDEQAQVILFERSGFVSYANCGLPYYLGGVITDPEALTLQTPESFWTRFRIDVRVRHDVTAIDTVHKTVTVSNLDTGQSYQESYDKLLLSPGAKPTQPAFSEIESERIFTLRTVEDTLRIRRFVEQHHPKTAVLAGGGYIGLEVAENLAEMGVAVTIVQRTDHLLEPLDGDMACFVHTKLRSKGISLLLGQTVEGFAQEGDTILTRLQDAPPLRADMALLAIGVTPDTKLAREAGLTLGIRGSIAVNDRMETSAPDVYAVGDAVEIRHLITGEKALISLAGPANKQGRIAADNICGRDSRYSGAQGSSVIKVFDLTVAVTGINEQAAQSAGIQYGTVILSPASHASYYPGAHIMTMKILYEKETYRLLGAQIIGFEGVDKRIDVLATAMQAGLSAIQLKDLDLAYAPPYSSAKDPVNMAGFMIENIATGTVKQFGWQDVKSLPRDG